MEDLELRIALVSNDREHGSRWLVYEAISIMQDLASTPTSSENEHLQQLRHVGQELMHAHPAMAAIAGAVTRILNAPDGSACMAREAAHLLEEYDSAIERITEHARPFLKGTLMTHSLSGTVLDVLIACRTAIENVIVLEGRPRYEGRDVARELSKHAIAVTLITDAQADIFLPQCHTVLVGADTVLENGDVLNKAGTALLAWAAHEHNIPLYVLCETLKISPRRWTGDLTQLEEKEPEEVLEQPIPGVTVHNFYFDHTPAKLVTKVITEQGMLSKQEIRKVASTLKQRK